MSVNILNRVVAQAKNKATDVQGNEKVLTKYKLVQDFKIENDKNSATVWKMISISNVYLKEGRQHIPIHLLTADDVRNCSVALYKARQANCNKGLGFKTNWELEQAHFKKMHFDSLNLDAFQVA